MKLPRRVLPALLGASNRLGGPVLLDALRRRRAKVLMYHGVPARDRFEPPANHYGYNVPLGEFEEHVDYLRRRCNVVALGDLFAGRGLSSSRINVVLTFDDGYRNNFTNAFSVLERHGIPAVFALATDFVCSREPLWNDVVEHAVVRTSRPRALIPWEGETTEFDLEAPGGKLRLYAWLLRTCVQIDPERRAELVAQAGEALDVSCAAEDVYRDEDYRPLEPDDVRAMARTGLAEFASHSVHHYLLSKVPRDVKRAELRDSKSVVEELTASACRTFCVPGGAYDSELLDEAFEAGYERVLTSDPGHADPTNRVLNRDGVFHRPSIHWFADAVHGPVLGTFAAARRMRNAMRARLS